MLDASRVDSEEDPQVANRPVHMVRSQSESSRNNSVIEGSQKHRSRNSRSNAKPRSSRQHSRASPMSGVGNARYEDSTSSSDDELARVPSRRQVRVFEEEHEMCVIPFSQRTKGPSHPGLASLRPSHERYDRLMSYRYHRLRRPCHSRNSASTLRLHKLITNLDLTFKENKFAGPTRY